MRQTRRSCTQVPLEPHCNVQHVTHRLSAHTFVLEHLGQNPSRQGANAAHNSPVWLDRRQARNTRTCATLLNDLEPTANGPVHLVISSVTVCPTYHLSRSSKPPEGILHLSLGSSRQTAPPKARLQPQSNPDTEASERDVLLLRSTSLRTTYSPRLSARHGSSNQAHVEHAMLQSGTDILQASKTHHSIHASVSGNHPL
jgi:hypothetical protein